MNTPIPRSETVREMKKYLFTKVIWSVLQTTSNISMLKIIIAKVTNSIKKLSKVKAMVQRDQLQIGMIPRAPFSFLDGLAAKIKPSINPS